MIKLCQRLIMATNYKSVFHLISSIAKEKQIVCVLIGGFAINYYKVTRQTIDVDFLITKDDFTKIAPLLIDAGYKQQYSQEVFSRFADRGKYYMDLDFMFVDKETLQKIIKTGKEIEIARLKFTVPSLENLIALKLHAIKFNPKNREFKDLPDIINLIRANNFNYKTEDFKNLCIKYGTKEMFDKITEILGK